MEEFRIEPLLMHYKNNIHSFHIPVMGIGFTIDTPVRVAQYGISSVVSLVDDMLMEKMREFYCEKLERPFQAITEKVEDFRAKRITDYLNLLDEMVTSKFRELKNSVYEKGSELEKYLDMMPDSAVIKEKFNQFVQNHHLNEGIAWLKKNLQPGNIDVNIMTKVDKENFIGSEKQPIEYNDAHAALRGFVRSTLTSSLVLSAGMNLRLYSYMEQFEEFLPDEQGQLKKKITLKVSDYRSAAVQGKMLAKKGIWISEYRVESGLNCGGHAFSTQGYLMGPILQEFKEKREVLIRDTHEVLVTSLLRKGRPVPEKPLPVLFTAQGGVGTNEEHEFLLEHYDLDSIGWGTPFLLVPEVTNVDDPTREQLRLAAEADLYLSNISPLGIPFNNLRNSSKDVEKEDNILKGRPGSPCTKRYACLSLEYSEKGMCPASIEYQRIKIRSLKEKDLDEKSYEKEFDKIVDRACICVGLGTSALIINNLDTKEEGRGVSICPGPNMAYFSTIATLKEMVDHIYGRKELPVKKDRPHLFVKELELNYLYLLEKVVESPPPLQGQALDYLQHFRDNILEGIKYYRNLFTPELKWFSGKREEILESLNILEEQTLQISFIQ
ncbi:MAG: hypothetical protein NTU44_20200 [Bacteroidetes bacterium]|nr:hypothetical protein [Bacteroidota bacterium]